MELDQARSYISEINRIKKKVAITSYIDAAQGYAIQVLDGTLLRNNMEVIGYLHPGANEVEKFALIREAEHLPFQGVDRAILAAYYGRLLLDSSKPVSEGDQYIGKTLQELKGELNSEEIDLGEVQSTPTEFTFIPEEVSDDDDFIQAQPNPQYEEPVITQNEAPVDWSIRMVPDDSSMKFGIHVNDDLAPKSAPQFLQRSLDLLNQRGKDYDKPEGERSMEQTVRMLNTLRDFRDRPFGESDGWLLMVLLKLVRQQHSPRFHRDSAEDLVSYAALYAEALVREDEKWGESYELLS